MLRQLKDIAILSLRHRNYPFNRVTALYPQHLHNFHNALTKFPSETRCAKLYNQRADRRAVGGGRANTDVLPVHRDDRFLSAACVGQSSHTNLLKHESHVSSHER